MLLSLHVISAVVCTAIQHSFTFLQRVSTVTCFDFLVPLCLEYKCLPFWEAVYAHALWVGWYHSYRDCLIAKARCSYTGKGGRTECFPNIIVGALPPNFQLSGAAKHSK